MELMCQALGDYGGSFPVTTVTGTMKNAGEANSTVSDFKNKRFLYCSEPEAGLKINSNYIKTLTGDRIKVRKLYAINELKPTYKLFMCCNNLPNFDSYDEDIKDLLKNNGIKEKDIVSVCEPSGELTHTHDSIPWYSIFALTYLNYGLKYH